MGRNTTAPDGTRLSALWEHLATGMRGAVVADAELGEMLAWADVVVSSVDGDADTALALDARIRNGRPDAVHVVTSGFGLTGLYRDWRRTPLIDWAAGGQLYLTGEPDREPLQGGGPWASYLTGATAAIGAMTALLHAARTGEGQLVDVGALESMASLHQWTITMYTHTGCIKRRWGNRFGESVHPIALYQATDGWISIVSPTYQQFEALCLLIDAPGLLVDEDLTAPAVRFDRAGEIDQPIAAWLARRSCSEAVAELQAAGVPASRVLTMTDLLVDAQLAARDYWLEGGCLGPQARRPHVPFRTDVDDVRLGPARRSAPTPPPCWPRPGSRPTAHRARSSTCPRSPPWSSAGRGPARWPAGSSATSASTW
jgi:crotonobetainyl-CoA:carnitine CoA-transferase CaiB-like acyl-CoA transferase